MLLTMIQITAAQGPVECERAVAITLRAMLGDAAAHGVQLDLLEESATPAGYKSVLLQAKGERLDGWLQSWEGTVQCIFNSSFRPGHKRKNWFVGVQRSEVADAPAAGDDLGEIVFQACRASGKGGQHVNTTDSAVHAVHVASGIAVKVMSERSQHANKRLARALIAMKLAERSAQVESDARKLRSLQHWSVDRGNPVRVLRE